MKYEWMLSSLTYRAGSAIAGILGILLVAWLLGRYLGRVWGFGKPMSIDWLATERFHGDVAKAQSFGRATPALCLLMLVWSCMIAFTGITGLEYREVHGLLWLCTVVASIIFVAWAWLEWEFAWPRILIARELKATEGMRAVRQERRKSI